MFRPRIGLPEDVTDGLFEDGQILTDGFGLKCVGFDSFLYTSLRQRFTNPPLKRKASTIGKVIGPSKRSR
jgi:hypothetical protein